MRYEKGQEAQPEVRVGWGGVGKPTRRPGWGRKAHPEVWEGLGIPLGGAGGVVRLARRSERPTRRSGRSRETHSYVRESHKEAREG